MTTAVRYHEQELLHVTKQQRQLVEKATGLLEKAEENTPISKLQKQLAIFADETAECFRLEEKLLFKRLNRIEFLDHQQRHRFFVDELRTQLASLSCNGQADTRKLFKFFTDWISFHVNTVDRQAQTLI